MSRLRSIPLTLGAWYLLTGIVPGQTPDGFNATARVEARLVINDSIRDFELTGLSPMAVGVVEQSLAGDTREGFVPLANIQSAHFRPEIDWSALRIARLGRNWEDSVRLSANPLTPYMPYLNLPNNNVAELVLQTGDFMMRSAEMKRFSGDSEGAATEYRAAYNWFRDLVSVDWSPVGLLARLKRIKCLLAIGRLDWAREYIGQISSPAPGDRAYGLYWLVMAEIAVEDGDFRAGMDAAVKSLVFETKDVDTFPDALMLSARCYEEIQEWHRARDVYYEIANVFPMTDWEDVAVRRLRLIRRNQLTEVNDSTPIENVFFGLKEDMEANVDALLQKIDEREERRKTESAAVVDLAPQRVTVSDRDEQAEERTPVDFDKTDLEL